MSGETERQSQLAELSYSPSFYVRTTYGYKCWCSISECSDCGVRAKYEDMHTISPCPNCGGKVKERVGRWVVLSSSFFGKEYGYWEIKGEEAKPILTREKASNLVRNNVFTKEDFERLKEAVERISAKYG